MPFTTFLNVTNFTTATQLDTFAQNLEHGMRIKGKTHDDGSFTLYASRNKSGLLSKITGRAKDRARTAQNAIRQVVLNSMPHGNLTVSTNLIFVRNLIHSPHFSKPSSTKLKEIANLVTMSSGVPVESSVPKLAELSSASRTASRKAALSLADCAHDAGLNITTSDKVTNDLKDLVAALLADLTKPDMRVAFPDIELRNGRVLIDDLTSRFIAASKEGEGNDLSKKLNDELRGVAKRVFQQVANEMLGCTISDDAETLTYQGKNYDRASYIAEGGFGAVVRFDAQDGSDSIAVKFENDDNSHDSFAQEIKAHRCVTAEGHDNILGFKGAARTQNGSLVIATTYAGAGDGEQAQEAITAALQGGKISKKTAQTVALTLIADVIKGMEHLHDVAGMTHIDFKPANILVTQEGVGKIADFGTTVPTENPTLRDYDEVNNATWKSPKVLYELTNRPELRARASEAQEAFRTAFFPNQNMTNINTLEANALGRKLEHYVTTALFDEFAGQMRVDGRGYDMFALGVTALNLLSGEYTLMTEQFEFTYEHEIGQGAIHERGVAPIGTHDGAVRDSFGDPMLDDFLNLMTHPDDSQRASDFGALLDHDIFQRIDIGGPVARDMLMAIMTDDDAKIGVLNQYLDA